jgi:hypothetical protein
MAQAYAVKFPAGKGVIVIAQIAMLDASGAVTAFGPMKDMPYGRFRLSCGLDR